MEQQYMPDYHDYQDALVAFVDILGFTHTVRSITDQATFDSVGELVAALKVHADRFNENREQLYNVTMTAVSDSVIFSIPYSEPTCASALIAMVHTLQYDLLATRFRTLVRGYIARGRVYHKNGLIFGEGYQEAYLGEQLVKGPPRVVVDPNVIATAKQVVAAHSRPGLVSVFKHLRQDPYDHHYFVDYLSPYGTRPSVDRVDYQRERQGIEKFIQKAIYDYREKPDVCQKYEWLSWYFDETKTHGV
jgi:class 3 adenylate cyclase